MNIKKKTEKLKRNLLRISFSLIFVCVLVALYMLTQQREPISVKPFRNIVIIDNS